MHGRICDIGLAMTFVIGHATSLFGNAFINESVIPIIQHPLADFMERLGSEAFTFFWQCHSHLGRQPEDKTLP
jgi:hypothetical protein